jgi:hypothetical protein
VHYLLLDGDQAIIRKDRSTGIAAVVRGDG